MDIKTFRKTATQEDWTRLRDHVKHAPKKEECLPAPELGFDFSYSIAATELVKRGLYTRKYTKSKSSNADHKKTLSSPAQYPNFVIPDITCKTKKIKRSVQLDEDVNIKLSELASSKRQYTHSAILNQILRDGLAKYGF